MLHTLTLRGKMLAAFFLIIALLAALSVVAMSKLSTLNSNSQKLGTDWLPSVEALGDVRTDIAMVRLAQVRQLLAKDPAARAATDRLMAERMARLQKHRDEFAKLISSPEEGRIWNEFETQWSTYIATVQTRFLPMARAGQEMDALHAFYAEAQKPFDELSETLGRDIELNVQGADAEVEHSRSEYLSARSWVIGMSVLALLAALALALLISAHVLHAIGGEPAAVGDAVTRIAAGDLSTQVTLRRGDETSILACIQRMQAGLQRVVGEVRDGAESVATASSQIAQGNLDLSSRTEEQASNLQQTAASLEQMASAVKNNADTAAQANQLADGASQVAAQGGQLVGEVVQTMADISAASRRIADIISVIDGIAFQTNILALNAAVEAARAGEHGKGFAVVATEVRNLAQRSATAAREIKGLIHDSAGKVDAGSELVSRAGRTMADIVAQVRRVSDLMGEITSATSEQSGGISQINTAVSQLDQTTQQNAALVEESAAASESLKCNGQRLLQSVSVFRLRSAEAVPA